MTSFVKTPDQQKNAKVATAIADEPCQSAVPIFPIRCSVAPSEKKSTDSSNKLPIELDSKLPSLDHAAYVLRPLRPESYVYVYNENSQNKLTCFFYTTKGQEGQDPKFFYLFQDGKKFITLDDGLGSSCIWADCNKNKTFTQKLLIGCTDAPPSNRTWKELKNNDKLRKILLPTKLDIQSWIETLKKAYTTSKPADVRQYLQDDIIPSLPNSFYPSQYKLMSSIYDFMPSNENSEFEWSEVQKKKKNTEQQKILLADMYKWNLKTQVGVVLYDPIGLTRELNHFVANHANKTEKYVHDNHHGIGSASTLIDFFENHEASSTLKARIKAETQKRRKSYQMLKNRPNSHSSVLNAYKQRINDKKDIIKSVKTSLGDEYNIYLNCLIKTPEQLKDHIKNYKKNLLLLNTRLEAKSKDVMIWRYSMASSLDDYSKAKIGSQTVADALQFYDRIAFGDEVYDDEDWLKNYVAYLITVYHLLSTAGITKEGQQYAAKLVLANPEESPLWSALGKIKDLWWNHIKNPTDGFYALFMTVIDDRRLVNLIDTHIARLINNVIAPSINQWYKRASKIMSQLPTLIGEGTNKISYHRIAKRRIRTIHEFHQSTTKLFKILARRKIYASFAATIAFITLIDLRKLYETNNADKSLTDQERREINSAMLGSTAALFIFTAALMESATLTEQLDTRLSDRFTRSIKSSAFVGGIGGLIGAVAGFTGNYKDGHVAYDLFEKGDYDAAAYTSALVVAGLLNSSATVAVGLIGVSTGLGGVSLGGLVVTKAGVATVLGYTAFAWASLGLGLFFAILFLGYLAASAEDSPLEIWLQQSYWGKRKRYLTLDEEITAMSGLMYRPHIEAEWNDVYGFNNDYSTADELLLTINLPHYIKEKSILTITEKVTKNGRELEKVVNRQQMNRSHNNNYIKKLNRVALKNNIATYELKYILDDQAKLELFLSYQPNKDDLPEIVFSGPINGKSWHFENDGFLSSTTDNDKFTRLLDKR